jgi:hypothetical protein
MTIRHARRLYLGFLPPLPLRFAETVLAAVDWFGRDGGEGIFRRGLKASGLAPLCRRSFSSGERFWGSLFARKLCVELAVGLRRGRNLSSDLRDPLDFMLSLDPTIFREGRRRDTEEVEWRRGRGGVDAARTPS